MTQRPVVSAPSEIYDALAGVLPRLAELGVGRLEVFTYRRPGEPLYWLAFLTTGQGRHTVGTPDLRDRPLAVQLGDLIRQLHEWAPELRPGALWSEEGRGR